jgi:hypothetical protein
VRLLTNPEKTAFVDLDELEAQLDQTTPYYVPWMIAEIRRLRADPPRCPRCGCYQFVYKGDRQCCADCGRE